MELAHLGLGDWSWEPTVLLGLAALVAAYVLAWRRGLLSDADDVSPWVGSPRTPAVVLRGRGAGGPGRPAVADRHRRRRVPLLAAHGPAPAAHDGGAAAVHPRARRHALPGERPRRAVAPGLGRAGQPLVGDAGLQRGAARLAHPGAVRRHPHHRADPRRRAPQLHRRRDHLLVADRRPHARRRSPAVGGHVREDRHAGGVRHPAHRPRPHLHRRRRTRSTTSTRARRGSGDSPLSPTSSWPVWSCSAPATSSTSPPWSWSSGACSATRRATRRRPAQASG